MLPGQGLTKMLDAMRNQWENNWDETFILLITEDFTPLATWQFADADALDHIHCDPDRTMVNTFTDPVEDMTTYASIRGGDCTYTNETAGEITIYGWMILDPGSEDLITIKKFPVEIVVPVDVEFRFKPELRLKNV